MEDQYTVVASGGDVTEQPVLAEEPEEQHSDESATPIQANEPTEGQPEHKRKGGWQRRIEKLERENELLRDMALKARTEPAKPEPKAAESTDDPKPKLDDFSDYEEYTLALARWGARQEYRETKARETAKADEERKKSEQKSVVDKWNEQCDAFRETHDDFDDVALSPKVTKLITPVVAEAVMSSDIAAELAYELGKNPAEVERIAKLSPVAAVREIGKIEARLVKQETKPEEKPAITKAPKPPTPVQKPSAAKAVDLNDPNTPTETWRKEFRKKMGYE